MVQGKKARTPGPISNSTLIMISLWVLVPPNVEMTPTSQDHWDDDWASQDLEDSKHHGDLQVISDSSLRLLDLESEKYVQCYVES